MWSFGRVKHTWPLLFSYQRVKKKEILKKILFEFFRFFCSQYFYQKKPIIFPANRSLSPQALGQVRVQHFSLSLHSEVRVQNLVLCILANADSG